jgi:hypothetical protein
MSPQDLMQRLMQRPDLLQKFQDPKVGLLVCCSSGILHSTQFTNVMSIVGCHSVECCKCGLADHGAGSCCHSVLVHCVHEP